MSGGGSFISIDEDIYLVGIQKKALRSSLVVVNFIGDNDELLQLINDSLINLFKDYNKEIKIQVHTSPVIEIKLLLTWLVFYVLSYMITIIGIPDIVFFLIKIVIFYFLLSNNFFNYKIT